MPDPTHTLAQPLGPATSPLITHHHHQKQHHHQWIRRCRWTGPPPPPQSSQPKVTFQVQHQRRQPPQPRVGLYIRLWASWMDGMDFKDKWTFLRMRIHQRLPRTGPVGVSHPGSGLCPGPMVRGEGIVCTKCPECEIQGWSLPTCALVGLEGSRCDPKGNEARH